MCLFGFFKKKKSGFIDFCRRELPKKGFITMVTYLDHKYSIETYSLEDFLFDHYCKIERNDISAIDDIISRIPLIADDDWENSLCQFAPTLMDIISTSHPRFVVQADGLVFKVTSDEKFVPNTNHKPTQDLYNTIPANFRISKDICCAELERVKRLNLSSSNANNTLGAMKQEQVKLFKKVIEEATHPIILKCNSKYASKFNGMIPYICYDDVMEYRFEIKAYPNNDMPSFSSTEGDVICKYGSVEAMVEDGWMLD